MSIETQRAAVIVSADSEFQQSPHVNVRKYWADVLRPEDQHGLEPPPQWCGAFCLWNLHEAGLGLDLHWEIGKGFLWQLHMTKTPQPGDIAYFAHWQHHALVRCMVGDDLFDSIDGNQGPVSPIKLHERSLKEATAFYSIATLLQPEAIING